MPEGKSPCWRFKGRYEESVNYEFKENTGSRGAQLYE
jgi:hypothetical protein